MLIIIVTGTFFLLILALMAINRYAGDYKNLTLLQLGVSTFILNIGIFIFLIMSFKNIKSAPGPQGPRGLQGTMGKKGPKQECPMCEKPLNTFGYQDIKHKEKILRMQKEIN